MRRLLIGLVALIVIVVAGLLIAPSFIPASTYTPKIEAAAEEALGREVALSDDISIQLFPRIQAITGEAIIANPEGFGEASFAQMDQFRVAVKLLPLLTGKIVVDELILVDPQINLVQLENGENNWTFPTSDAATEAGDDEETGSTPTGLSASLGDVRLTNGLIVFEDKQNDQLHRLEDLDIVVRMDQLNAPLRISGDGIANDLAFDLTAEIANLQALLDGETSQLDAQFKTDILEAKVSGDAVLSDTPIINLNFESRVPQILELANFAGMDELPFADALGTLSAKGEVKGPLDRLNVSLEQLTHASSLIDASLNGGLVVGEKISLDLEFSADLQDAQRLVEMAEIADMPFGPALGRASAQGSVIGLLGEKLDISLTELSHDGGLFSAKASGSAVLTETVSTDLSAQVNVADAKPILNLLDMKIPGSEALGALNFSTNVSGPLEMLQFSDMKFDHKSSLLDIGFEGAATVSEEVKFTGQFSIEAQDLKALARTAEIELPDGDVYRSLSLKGEANGGLEAVALRNAELTFDDIITTGSMALDLSSEIPSITGALRSNRIDATPYAVASNAAQPKDKARESSDWQTTPLDLSPLSAVEMDLDIAVEGLGFQFLEMGASLLELELKNGLLTANLRETSLYGGSGAVLITANSTASVPTFDIDANLSNVGFAPFLGALSNFNKVDGDGALKISLSGSGNTISDLMSSLTGGGAFNLDKGLIEGVDINALSKLSMDSLLSPSLPAAFGADKQTSFDAFSAEFSVDAGKAATRDFVFSTGEVDIPGQATLDLGQRKYGLSLFPKANDEAAGWQGFLPPIRIASDWNASPSINLDGQWLQEKLTAAATEAAKNEVRNAIAGELGLPSGSDVLNEDTQKDAAIGLITGALGLGGNTEEEVEDATETEASASSATSATPANAESELSPEPTPSPTESKSLEEVAKEKAEDELKKALGSIFQ